MRQGQQNRRGRGRSNNNNNNSSSVNANTNSNSNSGRKPQNPLARNYESSGPDVKIRGTAAQVAEKYMALARDAASSGDSVMAENYLQHAEHYNRIIMASQAQAMPPQHYHQGGEYGQGMGVVNGQYRPPNEGPFSPNEGPFSMRDQPQPPVEQPLPLAPGLEPQPEIAEEPAAQGAPETGSEPAGPRDADGRRRRRYPAGGPNRPAAGPAAEPGNAHNGSGNGLDTPDDTRPPDEILAN